MKHFQKNVLRLARQNQGSFLGAMMIIAIGIFIYVAMMDTLKNLQGQVERYYQENGLADVFAEVSGISSAELERLKEIPGISQVSGRMAEDVRLLAEGQEELVTVHLLSYNEEEPLNRISLSGAGMQQDSLYLGGRMAGEYGYEAGEPLRLLIHGEAVDFQFAGVCHAPDYIYSIPPGGAMVPDGQVYDIAAVELTRMEALTGKKDSFHELGFALKPGYTYEDVRSPLSERLKPYGLISLTEREDQVSFDMVDGEIGELVSVGTILPVMFMAISIFMMYVALKKMIDRDQSLIGTMKAFGLTDGELMQAYLFEGAVIGGAGAVLGSLFAIPFGQYMFRMYVDFFNLPDTVYHNYLGSRVTGFIIALVTGFGAVFLGVRDILTITPAQAMRAKAPAAAGAVRLPGWLVKHLGPMERMACRSIARNPFRGFLIVLAVGFPFSMSSVLFSFQDVADQMFMNQFEKIQVYDLQASLDRYVSPVRAVQGAEFLDGVEEAEAVCTTSAVLKNENLSQFVMLYGLNQDSRLWKIMDSSGTYYQPPQRGLIINNRTADRLHVKQGDLVEITCPGFTVEAVWVPVVQVIEESFGSGCYMELSSFEKTFSCTAAANTVLIRTETGKREAVKKLLLNTSQVTWLADGKKILESYRDMMGSMMAMIHMFAILSVASGGILIYNISMINIRDRITELGTLMILGESGREMGRMMLFEQVIYFGLGILTGFPGSRGIKILIEKLVMSESYSVHMNITPASYGMALFICFGITMLAWAAEMRLIRGIHLADILKDRE